MLPGAAVRPVNAAPDVAAAALRSAPRMLSWGSCFVGMCRGALLGTKPSTDALGLVPATSGGACPLLAICTHVRRMHADLRDPGPPNLGLSRQLRHKPQSSA
eukprot:scaffold277714_cov30-Tisochrysis_lutea.AAC.4